MDLEKPRVVGKVEEDMGPRRGGKIKEGEGVRIGRNGRWRDMAGEGRPSQVGIQTQSKTDESFEHTSLTLE